jgi:hypothetical protein
MSVTKSDPVPSVSAETQTYYLSRNHTVFLLTVSIAVTVVPLLILAWFSLDPDWMPEKPDFSSSSGRRRKGLFYALIVWALFVLFMKLPFWIRVPFLLWSSYKFLRFFSVLGIRAFDKRPDFVISPEGVSGWSGRSFHHVPWSAIKKLHVAVRQHKIWGFDVGSPKKIITLHGPGTGPRRFFDTLPLRRVEINYVHGPFPEKAEVILSIVYRYRPDLVAEEDLADLAVASIHQIPRA